MIRKAILTVGMCLVSSIAIAALVAPTGGGGVSGSDFKDHLTPAQRTAIQQKLQFNRKLLRERGISLYSESTAAQTSHPMFTWPTESTTNDPGHFGISNFVDHDPAYPDSLQDYQCGERTYDTDSGYNHKGMDVFSWPYPWLKMDHDEVRIIAAEPGIIIGKDDDNFDRNCSFTGRWNAVYVEHADGSVAWYGHLKKNSLTSKLVGQSVQAGEFLGVMGSSGQSTGPHLHLEVYDSGNALIDPSEGACNALDAGSWWSNQRPYYEPGINLVATHDAVPEMNNGCGVTETPSFQTIFTGGQTAYFALYLRDQRAGQQLKMKIYQPDNTIWREWSFTMNSTDHYSASWWYWTRTLPAQPQAGRWRWQVEFQGQTVDSEFTFPVPDISVSGSGAFGDVEIDSSSSKNISISNVGTTNLLFNSVGGLSAPFSIISNNCGASLAAGTSCTVSVSFSPTSTATSTDTLVISTNDPDEGTVNVSVSGTGTAIGDTLFGDGFED